MAATEKGGHSLYFAPLRYASKLQTSCASVCLSTYRSPPSTRTRKYVSPGVPPFNCLIMRINRD